MDWGLAKQLGGPDEPSASSGEAGAEGPDERTRAGAVLGTPSYMAPEQARGEVLDERADVFALGGVLCAILTGKPPYTGRSGREVWQKAAAADLDDALGRLAGVKDAGQLPSIARRCLSADPHHRFAHAGEVRAAIDAARNKAREVRKQYDLDTATADADRLQRRADLRARTAVRLGVGGLLVGVLTVAAALVYATDQRSRAVDAADRLRAVGDAREKELFPTLVAAMHRQADDGLFDRGYDGDGRARALRRLESTATVLDPTDAAHAHLLVYGAYQITGEDDEQPWQRAVEQYKKVAPEHTEVALGVRAFDWFAGHKTWSRLDRKVIKRLNGILRLAQDNPAVPEPLRQQARTAVEKVRVRESELK